MAGADPVFATEQDAKEYLVTRILAEARQEGIVLSDIERKMLYFSETGWTLPDISDVNDEFERDCDNDEYEAKIARIVRSIEKKNAASGGSLQSLWDDAVIKLSEGDHYILVPIGLGRSSPAGQRSKWLPAMNFYRTGKVRPPGDFFRLIVVAVALAIGMIGFAVIESWLRR